MNVSKWMTSKKAHESAKIFVLKPQNLPESDEPVPLELSACVSDIERFELPAHVSGSVIYLLGAILTVALIWAALAKVDIVAEAPGRVIPASKVKIIQPVADGVVESVFVAEAQQVKAGESLILLDRTPYLSEVKKFDQELEMAKTELLQHKQAVEELALLIENPATMPPVGVEIGNVSEVINGLYTAQKALNESNTDVLLTAQAEGKVFCDLAALQNRHEQLLAESKARERALDERRSEYATREKILEQDIPARQREFESSRVELEKVETLLAKTKDQESAYRRVFEEGAVSRVDYLSVQKVLAQAEVDLVKQQTRVSQLRHQVAVSQAALTQFRAEAKANLSQQQADLRRLGAEIATVQLQLRDNQRRHTITKSAYEAALQKARATLEREEAEVVRQQRRIDQLKASLAVAQHNCDNAELKSPIDGTVTNIAIRGRGQVVSTKEPLMTLVPNDSSLLIEASISNKDIGFVEKGQAAKLKFASFPFQEYGIVSGRVIEVEAHPQEDSRIASSYRVRIVPERTWIAARGKHIQFASGMAVTAEIVTRKRTILSIFLEPINNLKEVKWS